jgi:hypothetical protein
MGKPTPSHVGVLLREREPGELKHLSSPRKREDSASSGERKRRSPNRSSDRGCRVSWKAGELKENGVGKPARVGDSPVSVGQAADEIPEYRRTRGIQRETGKTTSQG